MYRSCTKYVQLVIFFTNLSRPSSKRLLCVKDEILFFVLWPVENVPFCPEWGEEEGEGKEKMLPEEKRI